MSGFRFLPRAFATLTLGLFALLCALPAQAADPYDGDWVVIKSAYSSRPPFIFQRLTFRVSGDRFSGSYVGQSGPRTMHGLVQTRLAADLRHTRKWLTWTEAGGGAVTVIVCDLEGDILRIHLLTNPVSHPPTCSPSGPRNRPPAARLAGGRWPEERRREVCPASIPETSPRPEPGCFVHFVSSRYQDRGQGYDPVPS